MKRKPFTASKCGKCIYWWNSPALSVDPCGERKDRIRLAKRLVEILNKGSQ